MPAPLVPTASLSDIAPSLDRGPLASAATAAVQAADRLGTSAVASYARAWSVPLLFDGMERAFATDRDPRPAIADLLRQAAALFDAMRASGADGVGGAASDVSLHGRPASDVATVTGEHYGQLFSGFSDPSFWDEPTRLLRTRLERNGIDAARWTDARVLDAGCGGGRYTVAWRLLGAAHAVGLDVSCTGLEDARRRVTSSGVTDVTFEKGSVLELPFEDDAFDVVFSNGVLHHTTDWRVGVAELVRVLRPGGLGWLYLIENPGGLFWDVVEILRAIMRDERRDVARTALRAIGIPGNRVFYMLDHVMVPINLRLTPHEIEDALADAGATDVRRLERGTDFDRVEQLWRGDRFAEVKYGVGENRYVFSA